MADAERIWLEPECCAEPGVGRTWCSVNEWACCPAGECDAPKPTEYVRADLVAAREAAAAMLMQKRCQGAACMVSFDAANRIAALPIPAADALARALDQARKEEREACAQIAEDEAKNCKPFEGSDGWASAINIRDAICARGKEMGGE